MKSVGGFGVGRRKTVTPKNRNASASSGGSGTRLEPKDTFTFEQGNSNPNALWDTARSRFKSWDGDRNGQLSNHEVETVLKNKDLTANEKATLETFRGRQSQLNGPDLHELLDRKSGATLRDLEAFRISGNGEARRLEEQFSIERELAMEPRSVKDEALAKRDRPADLKDKVGTRDYYIERYKDFRRRNPDRQAPDYYLNYGLKYFDRFHTMRDGLSPVSQGWVDRTAVALQQSMEERNKKPADFARLERDPEAFKSFAYGSHPSAYLDSGLQQVPLDDRVRIGLTPDPSDLLSKDGISQAIETGGTVVTQDAKNVLKRVGNEVRKWKSAW